MWSRGALPSEYLEYWFVTLTPNWAESIRGSQQPAHRFNNPSHGEHMDRIDYEPADWRGDDSRRGNLQKRLPGHAITATFKAVLWKYEVSRLLPECRLLKNSKGSPGEAAAACDEHCQQHTWELQCRRGKSRLSVSHSGNIWEDQNQHDKNVKSKQAVTYDWCYFCVFAAVQRVL